MIQAEIPAAWQEAFDRITALPPASVVLIVGDTDTGKSSFALAVARKLAETSERIAVVDADIGQGEIAPPGTVATAWMKPDATKAADLRPAATFFVGSFSASAVPLEHAVAAASAVRHARTRRADVVLVDTTGFVAGPTARRLKCAKAAVIQPALILAFGADTHPETFALARAASLSGGGAPVLTVSVPANVGRKPPTMRSVRRQTRLAAYFGDAPTTVTVPLFGMATLGATLGTGTAIAPHLALWAGETLALPVVHGETVGEILTLFVAGAIRPGFAAALGAVQTQFGCRTVRVVSLPAHDGVLLGLHDDEGRLFCLGRYAGFDSEAVGITVTVPGGAATVARERTRLLAFGRVRTDGSGRTVGEVKAGEL